ncbi:MAG: hypothetical protein ACOCV2_04655 [Persicimonas sp.]
MQDRSSGGSDRTPDAHASTDGSPHESTDVRRDEIEAAIRTVLNESLDRDRGAQRGRRPLDEAPVGSTDSDTDLPRRERTDTVTREQSWANFAILIGVFVAGLAAMALIGRAYTMGYVP